MQLPAKLTITVAMILLTIPVKGDWRLQGSGSTARQVDSERVVAILQQAREAALQIEDDEIKARTYIAAMSANVNLFEVIARTQAQAGDYEGAVQTAGDFEDPDKSLVLVTIATAQAADGKVQQALETAALIEPPSRRARALARIGEFQALAGEVELAEATFKQALEFAYLAEDSDKRDSALLNIVAARAAAGQVEEVRQLVEIIEDRSDRKAALRWLARLQAKLGDIEGALDTAEQMGRDPAILREIATTSAMNGDVEGAFQIVESLSREIPKIVAFQGIALVQAGSGDIEGALETIQLIEDDGQDGSLRKAGSLALIAAVQASSGQMEASSGTFELALRSVESLQPDYPSSFRAGALANIASVQAQVGFDADASSTLDLALQVALSIEEVGGPMGRISGLYPIAIAQATIGDLEGALRTADAILQEEGHGFPLEELAVLRVRAGDEEGAVAWAVEQPSPVVRSIALLRVAQVLLGPASWRRYDFF
jgi:tetratricopeptide (TPR) repeat protein